MTSEIVALAQAQARAAARRAAVPTAFALVAGVFVLFAVAGAFAALFFWLEPHRGPVAAALICAGVALVLAILMVLPLKFKRRRPSPPLYEGSLPHFVSLMAKTAPKLAPRQLIVAAALIVARRWRYRGAKTGNEAAL